MHDKFRTFLQLVNDQLLFSPDDYIVILDQYEWEKLGLSKINIAQSIQHLGNNKLILKEKTYNKLWKGAGIPTTSKGRIAMLNGHLSELAWQFVARIGQQKFKAQIVLEVDRKFDDFYREFTGQTKSAPVVSLPSKPELSFDIQNSVLTLNGEKIQIKLKSDHPYAHSILEYIFYKNDEPVGSKIYYSDILAKMFILEDEVTTNSCRRACHDIQEKVMKQTKAKIDDFFLHIKTGEKGWAQINPKYIPTP